MTVTMSRAERQELGVLIRKREKLAKMLARERSAQMQAEFDKMLAHQFSWDEHETWAKATAEVEKVVAAGNAAITKVCDELRIPKQFRPGIAWGWGSRGENASASRRVELRRVALSKIAAVEKQAFVVIERQSLSAQTEIIAHGLESPTAKQFFKALPDVKTLMPPLKFGDVAELLAQEQRGLPGYLRVVVDEDDPPDTA
jgi:hypothetical protein